MISAGDPGRLHGDDNRVMCRFCGRMFISVGIHSFYAHGIRADEYRELAGLNRRTSLDAPAHRRAKRRTALQNPAFLREMGRLDERDNVTRGGQSHREESRLKLRGRPCSPEARAKLSAAASRRMADPLTREYLRRLGNEQALAAGRSLQLCQKCGGRATGKSRRCRACYKTERKEDARSRYVEAIRRWGVVHGEPPKQKEWAHVERGDYPPASLARQLFGSWSEAITAAGFTARRRGGQAKAAP